MLTKRNSIIAIKIIACTFVGNIFYRPFFTNPSLFNFDQLKPTTTHVLARGIFSVLKTYMTEIKSSYMNHPLYKRTH